MNLHKHSPRSAVAISLLLCVASFLTFATAARAATNTFVFYLSDFQMGAVAYRTVKLTPLSTARAEGIFVAISDPISKVTDGGGVVYFTNLVEGTYNVDVTNRFVNTRFQITAPSTNAGFILNAKDFTTSGTNMPGNLVAYSQAASDARFARRTNAFQVLITNGTQLAFGITNIEFTTGVTGYVSGTTAKLGISVSSGTGTNLLVATNGVNVGSAGTVNWVNGVTGYLAGAVANLGVSVSSSGGAGLTTNENQFLGVPLSLKLGLSITNPIIWGPSTNQGDLYLRTLLADGANFTNDVAVQRDLDVTKELSVLGDLYYDLITASRVAIFNGNKVLTNSAAVDTTELEYLDGVSSAIQTQFANGTNQSSAVLQSATNFIITATNSASVTNWINSRQLASDNLTNWSTIPTGAMANVVSTTFLTNWANAISNLTTAVTNSATATNWITTRQPANAVLSNLVGTVARNVTNVISLSTTNATSKPLTNAYSSGVLTLFGLEQGSGQLFTMSSNIVVANDWAQTASTTNVVGVSNWVNAVSNYVTAATNSAVVTNWINSRQAANAVLTNLVGTVANNVTNVSIGWGDGSTSVSGTLTSIQSNSVTLVASNSTTVQADFTTTPDYVSTDVMRANLAIQLTNAINRRAITFYLTGDTNVNTRTVTLSTNGMTGCNVIHWPFNCPTNGNSDMSITNSQRGEVSIKYIGQDGLGTNHFWAIYANFR